MPVIDAHVHLYPPEVNRDPAGWAVAQGESHWATLCTRRRKSGRPVQGFPTVDEALRAMDAAGVDRAVLLGWYWENHETCVRQNRFYAECVRAHPARFSAFAAVQAGAGEAALAEIRRAHGDGLAGLGELSPHSQGLLTSDPRWQAVLALAAELKLPVNLHVTDPLSGQYPGRVDTPLGDLLAMARAFPSVCFILAHWGGRLWLGRDPLPANVYADTAASPLLYGPEMRIFDEGLRAFGQEQVLWGTDYPLDLYPRTENTPTLAGFLAEARLALSDEGIRAKVLGGNAARILGL